MITAEGGHMRHRCRGHQVKSGAGSERAEFSRRPPAVRPGVRPTRPTPTLLRRNLDLAGRELPRLGGDEQAALPAHRSHENSPRPPASDVAVGGTAMVEVALDAPPNEGEQR